jgi:hypothetical protein
MSGVLRFGSTDARRPFRQSVSPIVETGQASGATMVIDLSFSARLSL